MSTCSTTVLSLPVYLALLYHSPPLPLFPTIILNPNNFLHSHTVYVLPSNFIANTLKHNDSVIPDKCTDIRRNTITMTCAVHVRAHAHDDVEKLATVILNHILYLHGANM